MFGVDEKKKSRINVARSEGLARCMMKKSFGLCHLDPRLAVLILSRLREIHLI